ncbi:hypothetical protein [Sorangium sp. So ce590]|uniref:hypothetical protein n=1 Tax=unclassified Sorangium TaxID=2621164 RepID=UPI003F63AE95
MGIEIQQDHFRTVDYGLFKARLQQHLTALEMVLSRPGFGLGHLPREEALRRMLERYMAEVDSGNPVHAWAIPGAGAT